MSGHWIFTVKHYERDNSFVGECWRCSECGCASFDNSRFPSHEDFCHHCGAKMDKAPELQIREISKEESEYTWF